MHSSTEEGIWGSSVLRRVLKVKRRHKGSRNEKDPLSFASPEFVRREISSLLNQIAGFLAGCSSQRRLEGAVITSTLHGITSHDGEDREVRGVLTRRRRPPRRLLCHAARPAASVTAI